MLQATIYVSGSVETSISVNLTDTISSVLEQINVQNVVDSKNDFTTSNSTIIFNNMPVNPAFSLMFYGITDGSHLILRRKDQNYLPLNSRMTYSTDDLRDNILQPHIMSKCRRINSRTPRPLLTKTPATRSLQNQEFSKSLDYFPTSQINPRESSTVELTLGEIGSNLNNNEDQEDQQQINFNDLSYRSVSNSDNNFNYHINDEESNSILNPNLSLNRNSPINRSANDIVNKKMQKFFMEKCSSNMRDPEFVLQRFQDSINPDTAFEAARVTDIYRSRIESNSLSFRKLCKKYNSLSSNDRIRKNPSMPTILPVKADKPSTDLLPELSYSEGRPIYTGQ